MATPSGTSAHPSSSSGHRTLYPAIEPYNHGFLPVSPVHSLYFEECGNAKGNPVVVLHGGPGGGCDDYYRQFFDPAVYRIVLFDQRGAGRSTPHANLEDNTTPHLVSDIEKLRIHLSIDRWVVFGGSWGSTLAIAYAEAHPSQVKALVLRGIFTLRRKELLWFYQEGASFLFPDYWEAFVAPIPPVERYDLMSAYHRRLTGTDEKVKLECARAWSVWEMATSKLHVDPEYIKRASEDDQFAVAFARIECHYFVNGGFLGEDGELIKRAGALKGIPGVIVQGRYDVVCPMVSAWDLHKEWKDSELIVIPDAGHSMKEPGILSELIKACDKFKDAK